MSSRKQITKGNKGKKMATQPYTWVKRATSKEKDLMHQVVEGMNELAYEDYDTFGYIPEYHLERCIDAWVVNSYVAKVHSEVAGDYTIGQFLYSYSLVRCSTCGSIRELTDGQIEFCTSCGTNWE